MIVLLSFHGVNRMTQLTVSIWHPSNKFSDREKQANFFEISNDDDDADDDDSDDNDDNDDDDDDDGDDDDDNDDNCPTCCNLDFI